MIVPTDGKYTRVDPAAAASGLTINNKLPKTPDVKASIGPELSIPFANQGKLIFIGELYLHGFVV
jgi:hypothetical protein